MVITPFPRSSVCLITAERCHLFVFSTHDRPLPPSPWDSQPSAVPIQMGIKVQFYFTVLSSLQQIFSDSVFWLLNCSVLSDWSKTSVLEIKSNIEGILRLYSKGEEVFEHQTSKQQEETFRKTHALHHLDIAACIFPRKVLPTATKYRKSCFKIFKVAFLTISFLSFTRLTF